MTINASIGDIGAATKTRVRITALAYLNPLQGFGTALALGSTFTVA
jgi:hypothetical protein